MTIELYVSNPLYTKAYFEMYDNYLCIIFDLLKCNDDDLVLILRDHNVEIGDNPFVSTFDLLFKQLNECVTYVDELYEDHPKCNDKSQYKTYLEMLQKREDRRNEIYSNLFSRMLIDF